VFFKYDLFPLRMEVHDRARSIWATLIRLTGVIGGIFTCSGMLHRAVDWLSEKLNPTNRIAMHAKDMAE
jgi:hypothetical protein